MVNKVKVYVVTTGEYSSYRIDQVFSTKKKAEDYVNRLKKVHGEAYAYNERCIEPWVLDDVEGEWIRSIYSNWFVQLSPKLDLVDMRELDYLEDEAHYNKVRHHKAFSKMPELVKLQERYSVTVKAVSGEAAIKIAKELVAQHIAQKEGIA